jgi:hypothetical protein
MEQNRDGAHRGVTHTYSQIGGAAIMNEVSRRFFQPCRFFCVRLHLRFNVGLRPSRS